MAIDAQRRARQLARKAAKRKAQVAAKRRAESSHGVQRSSRVAELPIDECLAPTELFETGIGNVIVCRKAGNTIYAGIFLIDVYCLGVKNAILKTLSRAECEDLVSRLRASEALVPVQPSYARKLVEGAAAYAADLGFAPHPDFRRAREVFGDIDADSCPTEFEFGKDGKPLFASGPFDSPAECERIMATLTKRCGPGGFHYILGLGECSLDQEGEEGF